MQAVRPVVTRFAPSPTGQLHLGGFRTALFNYLFAKKHNGKFIVRIEDTDQSRLVPGSVDMLLDVLQWAGLQPTSEEPPQRQSKRLPLYAEAAQRLLEQGHAYRCFCSPERLQGLRRRGAHSHYDRMCLHTDEQEIAARTRAGEPHVVRMKVPDREQGVTVLRDIVRGRVVFPHSQVDDQIIMKSDGFPTYHLASVVDDADMRVSHVIRGEEWLPSTAKHVMLYDALQLELPQFAHLPLLLSDEPGGGKLSKRHAAASASNFIDKGYLPAALVNFCASLGFTPSREIMSLEELIQDFSLERVSKGGAKVDLQKLDWMNTEHTKLELQTDAGRERLYAQFAPFLPEDVSRDYALHVLATIHDRLSVFGDIADKCEYFWKAPERDPQLTDTATLVEAKQRLQEIEEHEWTDKRINAALKGCRFPVLRQALTRSKVGAPVAATMACLGRNETIKRIELYQ